MAKHKGTGDGRPGAIKKQTKIGGEGGTGENAKAGGREPPKGTIRRSPGNLGREGGMAGSDCEPEGWRPLGKALKGPGGV